MAAFIARPPEWALKWRVHQFMSSLPEWSHATAALALQPTEIPYAAPLGSLLPSQRLALVELLCPQLADSE